MHCPNLKCEWNKESVCSRDYITVVINNKDTTVDSIEERLVYNIVFTCLCAHKEEFKDKADAIYNGTKGFVPN